MFEICQLLHKEYGIEYILGHEEISPKRKIDPGPAFPLDKLRDKILYSARDEDESEEDYLFSTGKVIASKLNIRSGPDVSSDKIAKPLLQGSYVKILDSKNGWYKVQTLIEGWVSAEYIENTKTTS